MVRSLPQIAKEKKQSLIRIVTIDKSIGLLFFAVVDSLCRGIGLRSPAEPILRRHSLEADARTVLKRCSIRLGKQPSRVRIPAIHDEDYDLQLGKIDYRGKTVLDIGADIGSTADFFLRKGAKLVVAVEGSRVFFQRLKANAGILNGILPLYLFIDRPKHVERLILERDYDVLKMDIEGAEINLFHISDAIFSRIPEYIVEVHSDRLFNMMVEKCAKNNYEMSVHTWRPFRIVYARRRDSQV